MSYLYKAGDKVRIVSNKPSPNEGPGWASSVMDEWLGKKVTIKAIFQNSPVYTLEESSCLWLESWLLPIEEKKVEPKYKKGDIVRVIPQPPDGKWEEMIPRWVLGMNKDVGKEVKIAEVRYGVPGHANSRGWNYLAHNSLSTLWDWKEEWLIPYIKPRYKVGNTVRVISEKPKSTGIDFRWAWPPCSNSSDMFGKVKIIKEVHFHEDGSAYYFLENEFGKWEEHWFTDKDKEKESVLKRRNKKLFVIQTQDVVTGNITFYSKLDEEFGLKLKELLSPAFNNKPAHVLLISKEITMKEYENFKELCTWCGKAKRQLGMIFCTQCLEDHDKGHVCVLGDY